MSDTGRMRPEPGLTERSAIDLQADRPHPARVYDYLLGGKDNFPAGRPDPGEDPDAVTDAHVAVYGGVARRP